MVDVGGSDMRASGLRQAHFPSFFLVEREREWKKVQVDPDESSTQALCDNIFSVAFSRNSHRILNIVSFKMAKVDVQSKKRKGESGFFPSSCEAF